MWAEIRIRVLFAVSFIYFAIPSVSLLNWHDSANKWKQLPWRTSFALAEIDIFPSFRSQVLSTSLISDHLFWLFLEVSNPSLEFFIAQLLNTILNFSSIFLNIALFQNRIIKVWDQTLCLHFYIFKAVKNVFCQKNHH